MLDIRWNFFCRVNTIFSRLFSRRNENRFIKNLVVKGIALTILQCVVCMSGDGSPKDASNVHNGRVPVNSIFNVVGTLRIRRSINNQFRDVQHNVN